AAGAVTAVAAAVVVVQAPLPPSARLQPSQPVAHVVAAAARSADPASGVGLPAAPPPVLPLTTDLPEASGVTVRPAPVHATTHAAGAPPVIVGVVRDSRGEPAAHVPVTLRTAGGSGAAERTTKTDEAGRFRLPLRAHTRFVVTAELRGEPAARIEVDVPNRSAIRVEVDADAVDAATIEVELDSPGRRTLALLAKAGRSANQPLSRWCCRQAYLDRDTGHGRGCLKFDEGRRDDGAGPDQDPGLTGCELYGLKAQVSCHHFTRGGVSTGDLSRTEQLACDGRLM
ncbi:MAG TPA: carboxypeptidase-like regulatory domain-containing protein, partial [Polyangia bacterium]